VSVKNIEGNHDIISHKIGKGLQVTVTRNSEKKATKKATFDLPVELHKRLKTAAAEQEMTMLEIVEEALKNHLKS